MKAAKDFFTSFISCIDDEVKIKIFSNPTLIDTGDAVEEMDCHLCGAMLDRYGYDEHNEWWYEMEVTISESETPLAQSILCQRIVLDIGISIELRALYLNPTSRSNFRP